MDAEVRRIVWDKVLSNQRHPLTCGNDRGDQVHREYQAIHGGYLGELVKTENGMECPVCGWKQPPSVFDQIAQLTAENERLQRVVEHLTRGASELSEIVEGYLSGNGHDPKEEAGIKEHYPVAYELLVGNGYPPIIEAHLKREDGNG